MKLKFAVAIAITLAAFACGIAQANGASLSDFANFAGRVVNAPPVPAAASSAVAPAMKDWTIMVYGVYPKRDTASVGFPACAVTDAGCSLEDAGSPANLNIVGQTYCFKAPEYSEYDCTRYAVTKSSPYEVSKFKVDETSADLGRYTSAVDFIKWARTNFPAKKYALFMYGEGSGWKNVQQTTQKGMMYNDDTGHHISTMELRKIFEEAGRVNIFLTHSCKMQMAEVAFEMRGYVDIMFGSEEITVADLAEVAALVQTLGAQPNAEPAVFVPAVLKASKMKYSRANELNFHKLLDVGNTFSALNLTVSDEFAARVREWAKLVINKANECDAVDYAINNVLRFAPDGGIPNPPGPYNFTYANFSDLYNFVELVGAKAKNAAVKAKSVELESFIANKLVIGHHGAFQSKHGDYAANSHGISIEMIPRQPNPKPSPLVSSYRESSIFPTVSGWANFLDWAQQCHAAHNSAAVDR
ncbi:MAG: clostripain-related cysteine peptidase [Elusimicrobiales bacterium]|nr:clostripain-related cysteine peptidase [Elusimicrobiales bacterium]